VIVDGEQVRLVVGGGNQVEQNDTDRQRLGARHALPDLLEAGEQKAGVMRLVKIGFVPPAVKSYRNAAMLYRRPAAARDAGSFFYI
jgi:hypothetical protein